jgi:phosphoribosylformimino-5-aminoimidazole carboxamide ribotide isomerase
MIVYPAIDLRGGKVVRLLEGDADREVVFSENPAEIAQKWIDQGAEWLHVINLDGAFGNANDNIEILREIAKLEVNIQFGGGLRSIEDIEDAFKVGVNRVVIGTIAATNPAQISQVINKFGADHVCIAIDARDGFVTTSGWTEKTDLTPVEFGRLMEKRGVEHALYTDVNRDGSMLGVNLHDTVAVARNTNLHVIASGGIGRMIEIQQLAHTGVIAGVIIGMALYRNEISLSEALIAAKERK